MAKSTFAFDPNNLTPEGRYLGKRGYTDPLHHAISGQGLGRGLGSQEDAQAKVDRVGDRSTLGELSDGLTGEQVAGGIDDAMGVVSAAAPMVKDIKKNTVDRMDAKGNVTHDPNVGGKAASGASAGAGVGKNFGPWGAAIGAGVGALGGLVGGLFDRSNQPTSKQQILARGRFDMGLHTNSISANDTQPRQVQAAEDGIKNANQTKEIEVEKDEIVLRKVGRTYKKVADFKGGKSHTQGGEDYVVTEGDTIVPGNKRLAVDKALRTRDWKKIESIKHSLPTDNGSTVYAKKGVSSAKTDDKFHPDRSKNTRGIASEGSIWYDNLSEDMKAFYQTLVGKFPDLVLTSGWRDMVNGVKDTGRHSKGEALDLSSDNEYDKKIYEYLTETEEGLNLLQNHDLGFLDETKTTTKNTTGDHYHIGKDSTLADTVGNRLAEGNFKPVPDNIIQEKVKEVESSSVSPEERATLLKRAQDLTGAIEGIFHPGTTEKYGTRKEINAELESIYNQLESFTEEPVDVEVEPEAVAAEEVPRIGQTPGINPLSDTYNLMGVGGFTSPEPTPAEAVTVEEQAADTRFAYSDEIPPEPMAYSDYRLEARKAGEPVKGKAWYLENIFKPQSEAKWKFMRENSVSEDDMEAMVNSGSYEEYAQAVDDPKSPSWYANNIEDVMAEDASGVFHRGTPTGRRGMVELQEIAERDNLLDEFTTAKAYIGDEESFWGALGQTKSNLFAGSGLGRTAVGAIGEQAIGVGNIQTTGFIGEQGKKTKDSLERFYNFLQGGPGEGDTTWMIPDFFRGYDSLTAGALGAGNTISYKLGDAISGESPEELKVIVDDALARGYITTEGAEEVYNISANRENYETIQHEFMQGADVAMALNPVGAIGLVKGAARIGKGIWNAGRKLGDVKTALKTARGSKSVPKDWYTTRKMTKDEFARAKKTAVKNGEDPTKIEREVRTLTDRAAKRLSNQSAPDTWTREVALPKKKVKADQKAAVATGKDPKSVPTHKTVLTAEGMKGIRTSREMKLKMYAARANPGGSSAKQIGTYMKETLEGGTPSGGESFDEMIAFNKQVEESLGKSFTSSVPKWSDFIEYSKGIKDRLKKYPDKVRKSILGNSFSDIKAAEDALVESTGLSRSAVQSMDKVKLAKVMNTKYLEKIDNVKVAEKKAADAWSAHAGLKKRQTELKQELKALESGAADPVSIGKNKAEFDRLSKELDAVAETISDTQSVKSKAYDEAFRMEGFMDDDLYKDQWRTVEKLKDNYDKQVKAVEGSSDKLKSLARREEQLNSRVGSVLKANGDARVAAIDDVKSVLTTSEANKAKALSEARSAQGSVLARKAEVEQLKELFKGSPKALDTLLKDGTLLNQFKASTVSAAAIYNTLRKSDPDMEMPSLADFEALDKQIEETVIENIPEDGDTDPGVEAVEVVESDDLDLSGLETDISKTRASDPIGGEVPAGSGEEEPLSKAARIGARISGGMESLASYAPAIYNIVKGMEDPDKARRRFVSPQTREFQPMAQPQLNAIERAFSASVENARNLSGGMASNFRSNSERAWADKIARTGQVNATEAQRADQVASENIAIRNQADQYNTQANARYDEMDMRSEAATNSFLGQGIQDVANIGSTRRRDANANKNQEMMLGMMGTGNYDFDPATGKISYKNSIVEPPQVDSSPPDFTVGAAPEVDMPEMLPQRDIWQDNFKLKY